MANKNRETTPGTRDIGLLWKSRAAKSRGGATFTMVVFLLLLISTGFMYYFFQKSRALERKLIELRTDPKKGAEPEKAAEEPRSVGGYMTAMRDKIMGMPESPKPVKPQTESDKTPEPAPASPEEPVNTPPPSTPAPIPVEHARTPVPEATPASLPTPAPISAPTPASTPVANPTPTAPPAPFDTSPRTTLADTLPAPDPFEEDAQEKPNPTPRTTATPRTTPRSSSQAHSAPTPRATMRVRSSKTEKIPAPRSTPRKTPARSSERVGSMYDIAR